MKAKLTLTLFVIGCSIALADPAAAKEAVELDGGPEDPDSGLEEADLEADGGPYEKDVEEDGDVGAEPEAAGESQPEEEPPPVPAEPPCDENPRTMCGHTPRPDPTPVNFRGTETFIAEYVGDNGPINEADYGDDDNYWLFRNLLYLQASNRYFDSAVRLDLTMFQDPPGRVTHEEFAGRWGPGAGGFTTLDYDNDFRVERIHGTAHIGNLHITAGDFYVNFGRGMALSLIKLDDVGVDNALRGGRVEYRLPRRLKFVLVGGVVNSLNVDPITRQVVEDDPLDRIVGARIEWEVMDALTLGVHGVFMRPRYDSETEIDPERINIDQGTGVGVINGGASAELHLGGAHLYLEGNGQKHDNFRPAYPNEDVMDESGGAVFGEFSYDLSPFMIKAEGMFYRRWLMEGAYRGSSTTIPGQPTPYHHMVTLEPVWMVINSFGNAEGGRLTGDYYIKKSDTQLTLMSSFIFYEGGLLPIGVWEDHPPTFIVHPILKVRQIFGDSGISLALEGGFRYETTEEPEPNHEDNGRLWHVMADLSWPITGPHSVELKMELRRHDLHVSESVPHWITLATLGYDMSGVFGVAFIHEYSDETAGSDVKIGDWTYFMPRHNYLWAMLTYHPPKPLDGLTLRLLAGSQRGGIKCAGGVCREYPDAVGAKLEAVFRF